MHSNIERAVANVAAAKQKIVLSNVLDAYVNVAGFYWRSPQALVAFERALDKHPDSADKVDSTPAKLVAELRKNYWHCMLGRSEDAEGKCTACPSCGVMALVQQVFSGDPMQLVADALCSWEAEPSAPQAVKPKKSKSKRTKKRRLACKPVAFDPYAPSTSTYSL